MKNEVNSSKLIFASDKPVTSDELGTHNHLAKLLVQIVKSDSDNPLVVGLFGGWGTGKSSIAKMYDGFAKVSEITNVYVDAWMFANAKERFGAGLLRELTTTLIDRESLRKKIVDDINQRYEEWTTKLDLGKMTWLLLISVLLIFLGAVALGVYLVGIENNIKVELLIFLITTVVVNGLLNWVLPKIMVTYESRTIDESYNKVEHFQKIFRRIMKNSSAGTISIVVDNLDRVEPDDALEMIRMLKTFVSAEILGEKRIVLIVPCDENELACHLKEMLHAVDPHEFLRKFFNISIPIPELVHENIVGFIHREFEKIRPGLYPALNDEDAKLVSFIFSRAARKSPRQVKILINSFVGYWQSAGLVGTAGEGQGITPLGGAIYVCMLYLLKGFEFPKHFMDLFVDVSNKTQSKELQSFLKSIDEFKYDISELEWLSLQRLQVSDDEKNIANFTDIYYAITDLNWDDLQELISDSQNLKELIERLERKIREEDNIALNRFVRWILSLVAQNKLISLDLPRTLRRKITHYISEPIIDWISLVNVGLAEYIVQEKISPANIVKRLNELKESINDGQPTEEQLGFIIRLINFSKTDYWLDKKHNDSLIGALDGVIYHCISRNNELINVLLENIHVVIYDGTGEKLNDELISMYTELGLEEEKLLHLFDDIKKGNDGPYSFAAQWLRTGALDIQNISIQKNLLTLSSVEALLALDDISENVKKRIPDVALLSKMIGGIEQNCITGVRQDFVREAFYGAITLSIIAAWADKLGLPKVAQSAKGSASGSVWPQIVEKFVNLGIEDQEFVADYMDKYPEILNHISPGHLAILANNENLDILLRLEEAQYQNILEGVIGALIDQGSLLKAVKPWLSDVANRFGIDNSGNSELKTLFNMMQQKSPNISLYVEVVEAIKHIKRRVKTKSVVREHISWLLDNINWNDKNSIDQGIAKIMCLESISLMDEETIEKLRDKLNDIGGIDIIKSVLSDDSRTWIT